MTLSHPTRRQVLAWMAASAAAAACGGSKGDGDSSTTTAKSGGGGFGGSAKTVKVGVIAPFTGVGAFAGRIVNNSLDAAVAEIDKMGGLGGYKVELIKRDSGTDAANGVKAYQEFAGNDDVIGVLWCGAPGLFESLAQIQRDNMPVIAVYNDLYTAGQLYPAKPQRSIFQLAMPDEMGMDLLLDYAANDREYERIGMIYDGTLSPYAKDLFTKLAPKHGIKSAGVETYQLGDSDFGPQLQRLKAAKGQSLFIWGVAGDTAGIVKGIDGLGGRYVDTPTAKAGAWKPQIMGSPGGTGEHTWADLAGEAARPGTMTAWHIGGVVGLPSFPIRGWMKEHLNKTPTGGEESPADGLAALLLAAEKAGGTDRGDMVEALEALPEIKFASAVGFSFTKDRHLAKERDDLILVTLERPSPPPAYVLGKEWTEVFAPGYVGPTNLVDFTLEANRRKHPAVVAEIVEKGYGTWGDIRRQGDAAKAAACRAVH